MNKVFFLAVWILAAASQAQAQTPQVWTCTVGQPLGSGHWAPPANTQAAEFCTGLCGNTPTGVYVSGTCKLPSTAALTDTVHATLDNGVTSTWLLKSTPSLGYSAIVGANVTKVFTWTPPTQNEDTSPLTNLAGYNFYESVIAGAPMAKLNMALITTPSYTTSLPPGSYQFAVTAVNTLGVESAQSASYALTIPVPAALKPAAPAGVTSK